MPTPTANTEARQRVAPRSTAAPCWLVVHELQDLMAAALAQALHQHAAAHGVVVRSVPVPALMAWVQWSLRIDGGGARCTLQAPAFALADGGWEAGPAGTPGPAPLAAVINRSGPVALPGTVVDADYKSAEWSALLAAWLCGLTCPVINRPLPHRLHAALQGPAAWRQAAAARGLPVWAWKGDSVGWSGAATGLAPAPAVADETPGLLVVGQNVFEAPGPQGPGWTAAAHGAAAQAAADCGCQLLAWLGRRNTRGHWCITGAAPWPDLRAFPSEAGQALAQQLTGAAPAARRPSPQRGPSTP